MLNNYFKTAFRQAKRNRLYTIINLFGLSVAIACCLIIFLFVSNEFKFDKFHKDAESIYRVTTIEEQEGVKRQFAHAYLPYLPILKSQRPEIVDAVRLLPQSVSVANKERNVVFQENNFCYADSNFFEMFSFRFLQGDSKTALNEPHNLLITEAVAKKYFGKTDVIGKELVIDQNTSFTIAGILEEMPEQSSIQFDMLAPMAAAKDIMGSWVLNPHSTWHHPPTYSFVKFNSVSDFQKVEQGLVEFEKKFLPDYITKIRSHAFQNLTDIHFSSLENEQQPTISKSVLYVFIAAGILILLIAAFNFTNLFLARIVFRLRGVGIQRVMGARNRHVWWQTVVESLSYLFTALFLSVLWISLFLPAFNSLMSRELNLFTKQTFAVWLWLCGLLLAAGFLISVFPSFILSRFKLINVLKGKNESLFPRKKVVSLQSAFVILQFTIAVIMIIATVVMQSQMNYIRNKDLGLKKEQVVILPVRDEKIQESFEVVKNKLLQVNGVTEISAISNFPWERGYYDFQTKINNAGNEVRANAPTLLVDEDFIRTLDMKMAKGRNFSKDFKTDAVNAFVINEAAATKFGITDPQGVKIEMEGVVSGESKKGELIGIVKDFHLRSLHNPVEPLILTVSPETYYIDNIVVKLSTGNISGTLNVLESQLKEISPERPFEFFFLDNAFEKLYQKEARLSSLFNYFSFIAIVIACLGLLGIVAFAAAQRMKEIGIRKVLGASVPGIVSLLTRDFLRLIIVAIIIASPLAWWFMNQWLKDFAYRVNVSWWVFVAAGVSAILIAVIAVGFQAIRAAVANPVKSLRTE